MLGSQLGVGAWRALCVEGLDGHLVSVSGQLDLHFVPFDALVNPTTLRTEDPVLGATIRFDVARRGGGILGGVLLLGSPSFATFADCTVYVDLGGLALPIAFQNGWSTLVAVPNVPSLSRAELRAQAVLGPFAAPPGWSSSDAWALRVGN